MRKELTFTGDIGDLSDVDVKRLHKITSYNLTRNDDNKWTMVEEKIEWLLNILITPPYMMMGKAHNLTKITNSGIVSPLPENPGHMLFSRPAVKHVSLNLVAEFNDIKDNLSAIPHLSTIIIEVLFVDAPEDAFEILPGLSIKWLKKHRRQRYSIIYMGASPVATLEGVQIIKSDSISLTKIFMPYNMH